MNKISFWNMTSSDSLARLADWADEMDYESTVFCPVNDGHQRAGKRQPNLRITLPGRKVEDFVWTWLSECLLTDRVLDLFKSNGFTGFDVRLAKSNFKRAKEPPPPAFGNWW